MTIYLIRHGKTQANEQHLYCGKTDLPLSEQGRRELTGRKISVPEQVRFLSSGMRRCNETLALLFGDVPYEIDWAFREIDFGIFEMKSYSHLKDDPAYQTWLSGDNQENIPPQGESGRQMIRRVMAAFAKLKMDQRDVVLVTHGGVIAAIMAECFPEEEKNRYQWQPEPGCGYQISEDCYTKIP